MLGSTYFYPKILLKNLFSNSLLISVINRDYKKNLVTLKI